MILRPLARRAEASGAGNGRIHGFGEALCEHEALLASYAAKGYDCVTIPRGPVAARVAFVEAELEGV